MKRILSTLSQKWPEYLLEILVITVGILGAFTLNAWKENSDVKREVRKSLVNLVSDLEQDSVQFGYHIEASEKTLGHIRRVIEIVQSDAGFHPDTLEFHYFRAKRFLVYVPQRSAFEAMNQLGLLSGIRSDSLLYELQTYYSYTQPNAKIVRDFEKSSMENSIGSITTIPAIVMKDASWNDLPLDYNIVKSLLLEPENFKRVYDYGKTEEFLINWSGGTIKANQKVLNLVRDYLKE